MLAGLTAYLVCVLVCEGREKLVVYDCCLQAANIAKLKYSMTWLRWWFFIFMHLFMLFVRIKCLILYLS